MSLQTWLLIIVIVLLVALLAISFRIFSEFMPRVNFLQYRLSDYLRQTERWPPFFFPNSDRLNQIIARYEERYGFHLTVYARQMLIIPVEEQIQDSDRVDWADVDESINKLFEALREDDSDASRSSRERKNSVGIIKAFHKRFCNIPPFCVSTEREERPRDR
jgi:hypothetical protein